MKRRVVHLHDRYVPHIQYMVHVRDLVLCDYLETTKTIVMSVGCMIMTVYT